MSGSAMSPAAHSVIAPSSATWCQRRPSASNWMRKPTPGSDAAPAVERPRPFEPLVAQELRHRQVSTALGGAPGPV